MNNLNFFSAIRYLTIGLMTFLVCVLPTLGQNTDKEEINQAETVFHNGNFQDAIRFAKIGLQSKRSSGNKLALLDDLEITINSYIALDNFDDAEKSLTEALEIIKEFEAEPAIKARIYFCGAALNRFQRKHSKAFEFLNKAISEDPDNSDVKAEYYLDIGRILYSSGFDISAIIWLEKAEKIFDSKVTTIPKLDTYRFLSLAWSAKSDFERAIKYSRKLISESERTDFKFKHREALYSLGTLLSATGQKSKAFEILVKGQKQSVQEKNVFQSCLFTHTLMLNYLYEDNVSRALKYLNQLVSLDKTGQFSSEILLGKAIILAFTNESEKSDEIFSDLLLKDEAFAFSALAWKITIAERGGKWEEVVELNHKLFDLTDKYNFQDDLPTLYFTFAKAYYNLKDRPKSIENLEKSISLIEEIRKTKNSNLSLSLFETYHDAYRLLTQIKLNNAQESFELADFLKARFLKDKINNSALTRKTSISPSARQKLENLSLKFIDDQNLAGEIEKHEKLVTNSTPELDLKTPDLTQLETHTDLKDTAIVSYFFTMEEKLLAFVWEKNQPLKIINLPVSESEIETDALTAHQKIKNLIFFKRDGKDLYDKLLQPLSVKAKHLIIIPDKALWKIPFQALSPDGKNYLIEEKLISYSPSISILLDQFKKPKPDRQSLQVFANSTFENTSLQYVNSEAIGVADIYKTKPILNATIADFENFSDKSDINHFSMHAQVDNEQPLNSFLAFRKNGKNDGRLTVEEILDIKLKQGSLAFLASCDTTNVLNGEGLVSLSWAMMASGATTVISAQWEANDKSTEVFTKSFFENYKKGSSSAEALQKASLEMIQNKSNNMHEPYYWAEFTLNGDSR